MRRSNPRRISVEARCCWRRIGTHSGEAEIFGILDPLGDVEFAAATLDEAGEIVGVGEFHTEDEIFRVEVEVHAVLDFDGSGDPAIRDGLASKVYVKSVHFAVKLESHRIFTVTMWNSLARTSV